MTEKQKHHSTRTTRMELTVKVAVIHSMLFTSALPRSIGLCFLIFYFPTLLPIFNIGLSMETTASSKLLECSHTYPQVP